MPAKPITIIGVLGSILDAGTGPARWEKWRPTVSLFQQEDLLVKSFVLLYQKKYEKMAAQVSDDIRSVSPETKVTLSEFYCADPWDFEEVYSTLHDFVRQYPFEPDAEDYLVHMTTGTHVIQICLFLLTESHQIPGKLIQTTPPKRESGPGTYSIIDLDLSKYDKLASRFQKDSKNDISFLKSGIDTLNSSFNSLIEQIERVAINSKRPLLITGPTGAGKSQLARRIYELKRMRHQVEGKYVEVNCATLRGDMAMSALFGHVRGAFSGALNDRRGLLREADKGLIFLDEVAELGLDEQAMLLRALEEKIFLPLGSDKEVMSDFQLICGTNRDLAAEVEKRNFREDLLARINLWTFRLPGLKDRPEDIAPNLNYELDQFEKSQGTRITFNKEALKRFLTFATSSTALWKTNFRDLNGAVTRMATFASGGRITEEIVNAEINRLSLSWQGSETTSKDSSELDGILTQEQIELIDPFEKTQLEYVIKVCKSSKSISEAGRKLFSVSRNEKKNKNDADRLRKYLSRFAIEWRDL